MTKSANPERIRLSFEADKTPIGVEDMDRLLNIGYKESLYYGVPYADTPWSAHP